MTSILAIIIGVLATRRITQILVDEDIFLSLREYFGIMYNYDLRKGILMEGDNKLKNFIGNVLSCHSCTSVWVSMFVVFLFYISQPVFYVITIWMVFSYLSVQLNSLEGLVKAVTNKLYK